VGERVVFVEDGAENLLPISKAKNKDDVERLTTKMPRLNRIHRMSFLEGVSNLSARG
jgi:hypothetical protein